MIHKNLMLTFDLTQSCCKYYIVKYRVPLSFTWFDFDLIELLHQVT